MRTLTDRQKLLLNEKNIKRKLSWHEWTPKFKIGHKVKIIDIGTIIIESSRFACEEWEKCDRVWEYLDKIRKDKVGDVGIILGIDILKVFTRPIQLSPYYYRVKFSDNSVIVFGEPYLKRKK